jgi:hypothetical protein
MATEGNPMIIEWQELADRRRTDSGPPASRECLE